MPRHTIDGRNIRTDFESWGELLDTAVIKATTTKGRSSRQREGSFSFSEFFGSPDFETALDLARNGWPEGERHVKRLALDLFDKVSNMIERPYPVYDVEGSEIDVARYLEGEPECWQRMEERVTEGPGRRLVRLVYVCTVAARVSAETIRARGAALVALIHLLEYAGHGVEVTLAASVGHHGAGLERAEQYVNLKAPEQPLDLPRLAFALIHPSSYRRLIWAVQETLPEWAVLLYGFRENGTYGSGRNGFDSRERGEIYIGGVGGAQIDANQWTNPEAARAWIIEQLKAQGVAVREVA